jgi:hypothetical protein
MLPWSSQISPDAQAKRYRLVLAELDGILQPDGTMHPSDVAALRAAHAAGVKVVLASALPPQAMHRYWAQLGLGTPVIALNGALVYDFPLHRQITGQSLQPAQLRLAMDAIRNLAPRATVGVQHGDTWSANRLSAACQELIKRTGIWPRYIGDLSHDRDEPAYQLWVEVNPAARQSLEAALNHPGVNLAYYTEPARLVLQAASASRGWALAALANLLEIPANQVMTIGSGSQDRSMLQSAAFAALVSDVSQELQASVDGAAPAEAPGAAQAVPGYVAMEGSNSEPWPTFEP